MKYNQSIQPKDRLLYSAPLEDSGIIVLQHTLLSSFTKQLGVKTAFIHFVFMLLSPHRCKLQLRTRREIKYTHTKSKIKKKVCVGNKGGVLKFYQKYLSILGTEQCSGPSKFQPRIKELELLRHHKFTPF